MKQTYFAGLLVRKERWSLSSPGKLLVLALGVVLAIAAQRVVNPFLSVSHPVQSDFLIVEAWVGRYVMRQAACEFKRGHYRKLFLVHGFHEEDKTYEDRNELVKRGVQPESIEIVSSPAVRRDRTYHLALAVRDWFQERGERPASLDVITLGPHARRSKLMFEKAFGNSANIGIVALDDLAYDGEHWWRSSEGVREVVGEVIAYIYARFYFVWT